MQPSEEKLRFVIVGEVLSRSGDDSLDTKRRKPNVVLPLNSTGFIEPNGDGLTKQALLTYFETFGTLDAPHDVKEWADRFAIPELRRRRPNQLLRQRGQIYQLFATMFIGEKAGLRTWFHELGRVVCTRIDKERIARLAVAAKKYFLVISNDEVSNAIDPDMMQKTTLPKGLYLKTNWRYCGLDHSGEEENTVNDEIWAILFSEYCGGFEFPPKVRGILEEIITGLTIRQD